MDGMKVAAKVLVERHEPLRHLAVKVSVGAAKVLLDCWLSPQMRELKNGGLVAVNDILAFSAIDGTEYGLLRSTIAAISYKVEERE